MRTLRLNKSLVTNLLAAGAVLCGLVFEQALVLSVGLFALSGAVTNWLAVHMLFEKVPGLYGSGVIPARFEEFKSAIRTLMMEQFFTQENIQRFLSSGSDSLAEAQLAPVIEKVDLSPAFDSLVSTIEESSFGGMLNMLGGTEALTPLKAPFCEKMKDAIIEITHTPTFQSALKEGLSLAGEDPDIRNKISDIIEKRLNELTPQLVKQMVQDMIRAHLGWLVVWGGVFGGLIGLLAGLLGGT